VITAREILIDKTHRYRTILDTTYKLQFCGVPICKCLAISHLPNIFQ